MRALIVDDQESARLVLTYTLKSLYEMTETLVAEGVDQGLDILKAHPDIDVVFLDICMPLKDGIDFLKEKSAMPSVKKIPVFMTTCMADAQHISLALINGATGYLIKPVMRNKLIEALEKLGIHLKNHG